MIGRRRSGSCAPRGDVGGFDVTTRYSERRVPDTFERESAESIGRLADRAIRSAESEDALVAAALVGTAVGRQLRQSKTAIGVSPTKWRSATRRWFGEVPTLM